MKVRNLFRQVSSALRVRQGEWNSGQAIILIAVGAMGLIAIMGLAIDGGRLLFLGRDAQNAADAAVIAATRAMCQGNPSWMDVGWSTAEVNGFDNRGLSGNGGNVVNVMQPPVHASIEIDEERCVGCFVEVEVIARVPPSFIGIIYGGPLEVTSRAIGACNPNINGSSADTGIRALFGLGESCTSDISGSEGIVTGGMHSNGTLKVSSEGLYSGTFTYYKDYKQGEGLSIDWGLPESSSSFESPLGLPCWAQCFGGPPGTAGQCNCYGVCDNPSPDNSPYRVCESKSDPLGYKIADFRPGGGKYSSDPKYHSYTGDCNDVEDWLYADAAANGGKLDGIYYTSCPVHVQQDNLHGTATFVTEEDFQWSGGNTDIAPYLGSNTPEVADDLLVFANGGGSKKCEDKDVKMSGSGNHFKGNIYAPNGRAEMSASGNSDTKGCVVAYAIDFSGSTNKIICDPGEVEGTPGVFLTE